MGPDQSWTVIDAHRRTVVALLGDLAPAEWQAPSLCRGWTVREVAAHLSMAATTSIPSALLEVLRARGGFDRMIHDSAVRRAAARTDAQIVADLEGVVGSRRLAPGTFWRDPLLDVLVHAQDIARPLGRTVETPTEAAVTATEWAWTRRFPFFPGRRLRGVRLVADDADWSRGEGPEVTGPIASMLLLSTGREVAMQDLHGPGLPRLARV